MFHFDDRRNLKFTLEISPIVEMEGRVEMEERSVFHFDWSAAEWRNLNKWNADNLDFRVRSSISTGAQRNGEISAKKI